MNRERKFHAWFIDQHGTKPGGRVSDESLRDTAGAGNHARKVLAEREIWEARYQSALYAWNAKDKP
jgi:hypothetical protein